MWRKSSYCDSACCVEVAFHTSSRSLTNGDCVEVEFHKSSRSSGNGNCVEVGGCPCGDEVLVRDSKDPGGPHLKFSPTAFDEFLAGVKAGQFDRR